MSETAVPNPGDAGPFQERRPLSMWMLPVSIILLLGLYIGYFGLVLRASDLLAGRDFRAAAEIGDSYGVLSGILNGAGLIAAVVAVILQRRALQETQEEVQVTAKALGKQVAEATRSADALEQNASAARLLATVQGLTALLANLNTIRTIELSRIHQLEAELVTVRDASITDKRFHRKQEIERELSERGRQLDSVNNNAVAYERELAGLLRKSGVNLGGAKADK